MKEFWKPLIGYEGLYEVSSLGELRRSAPGKRTWIGKIIKKGIAKGYYKVDLYGHDKKHHTHNLHRLLALTFLGPPPTPLHTVNHKDGIKLNNRIDNLEWATKSEQMIHAYQNGLSIPKYKKKGDGNQYRNILYGSNLGIDNISYIRNNRGLIPQKVLAQKYNTSITTICSIQRCKSWEYLDK